MATKCNTLSETGSCMQGGKCYERCYCFNRQNWHMNSKLDKKNYMKVEFKVNDGPVVMRKISLFLGEKIRRSI